MKTSPPPLLSLALRQTARDMRRELSRSRKLVILVPAPRPRHRGHMVRQVEADAPDWYQRICQTRTFQRHHRGGAVTTHTRIHRYWILRSLARIAAGKAMRRKDSIDALVLPFVRGELDARAVPF